MVCCISYLWRKFPILFVTANTWPVVGKFRGDILSFDFRNDYDYCLQNRMSQISKPPLFNLPSTLKLSQHIFYIFYTTTRLICPSCPSNNSNITDSFLFLCFFLSFSFFIPFSLHHNLFTTHLPYTCHISSSSSSPPHFSSFPYRCLFWSRCRLCCPFFLPQVCWERWSALLIKDAYPSKLGLFNLNPMGPPPPPTYFYRHKSQIWLTPTPSSAHSPHPSPQPLPPEESHGR